MHRGATVLGSGRAEPGPSCVWAAGSLWPVHARAQTLHVRCGGGTRPEASGGSGRYGQTCTERVTGAQGAPGESSVMLVTSRVREDRHAGVTRAAPGEAEYARGEPGRVGVVSQGHTTRAAPRRSTYMTRGIHIAQRSGREHSARADCCERGRRAEDLTVRYGRRRSRPRTVRGGLDREPRLAFGCLDRAPGAADPLH